MIVKKGEPKPRRVASSGLLPTISSFVIEQAKNPIEVTHSICMDIPNNNLLVRQNVFLCHIDFLVTEESNIPKVLDFF